MRIAVLGSGGIGGYYGARLAAAGHDVVLIARGPHLEAMQRDGLTVSTPAGETTIPEAAVADTRAAGRVDLVVFAVKTYDTGPAARALPPLMADDTTVLTLQNGVDQVGVIASVVGADAVLAGAVYVALQLVGPGVILRAGGDGKIVFGEAGGAVTERVRRIAGAFQQSDIAHDVSPNIRAVLWEKFLFITGVGAVTALARSGIGPILASGDGRALLTASCREIVAVAEATGAPLRADAVDAVMAQAATLPGPWRSSMARDLDDGRRLEVDALSGAVVRRGRSHGIPTPVHQTIAACLSIHQPVASGTARAHAVAPA